MQMVIVQWLLFNGLLITSYVGIITLPCILLSRVLVISNIIFYGHENLWDGFNGDELSRVE